MFLGDRVANKFPNHGFHGGHVVGINESSNKPFRIAWDDRSFGEYTQKQIDKWRVVVPPFWCTQCQGHGSSSASGFLWLDRTLPKNEDPDRWPTVFCDECKTEAMQNISRVDWDGWGETLHCDKAMEVPRSNKRARTSAPEV